MYKRCSVTIGETMLPVLIIHILLDENINNVLLIELKYSIDIKDRLDFGV